MPHQTPLHDFHRRTGAVFHEQNGWTIPAHFGNPLGEYEAAVDGAVRVDLSQRTRIEVSGPDAPSYLHNLSTQDIKGMPVNAGCEAFFCTSKARVIAHVHISRFPPAEGEVPRFLMDAISGQNEIILNHLIHYRISEQVELADATQNGAQFLVVGPAAASVLEGLFSVSLADLKPWHLIQATPSPAPSPSTPLTAGSLNLFLRARDDLSLPAFELWYPTAQAEALWNQLGMASLPSAGSLLLDTLRIEAGTPVFGADIDDQRFVAEVNRTEQAISYTKGCFLGQEPIVMARDRGHLNRLLLGLIAAEEGEPFVPGAKVFQGEAEVGQVTSSTFSPRLGKVIALAYLKRGCWEPGTMATVFPPSQGRAAAVSSLPFVAS